MFLIINTTEDKSQVILADNQRVLARRSFLAHVEHSEKLLPEIERLLKIGRKKVVAGLSLRDLEAIIVITGPGSFTGCRVGVATANAMSFALDIPVIGISKNEIIGTGVAHFSARNNAEVELFSARKFIKEILKVAQNKLKAKKIKFTVPFYAHPPHITKAKQVI